LIPTLLVLIEYVTGFFSQHLRKNIHYIILTVLLAVVSLIILKKYAEGFSGNVLLTVAVFAGISLALAYIRLQEVRKFLTILVPVIFIFPYLFLFDSPTNKVVFPGKESFIEKEATSPVVKIENPPPIVMVIFDEFLVTSLMDENHTIDSKRYPNFTALAKESTWFRNATTVGDNTGYAVPAIMTGKYPEHSILPILADHPDNIFTLLADIYEIQAFEPITQLCPKKLCNNKDKISTLKRIKPMISDLLIVYLHILVPGDMSTHLPLVTQSWEDFGSGKLKTGEDMGGKDWERRAIKTLGENRLAQFNEFINSINYSEKPTLYFLHTMLPHSPYKYLPSGKMYNYMGFSGILKNEYEKWTSDKWAVMPDYQRYLLQVGFVDNLLGKLLNHLKKVGLYERSLIVITADHGVSYKPGDFRRPLSKSNFRDIMPVPLFIKLPDQKKGEIDDRNVEITDILPSVADFLNIELPWSVDGQSVFNTDIAERKNKIIYFKHAKERMELDSATLEAKYITLEQMLELFGAGDKKNGIFNVGPHSELIGRLVKDVNIIEEMNVEIQLDQSHLFSDVDPDSSFVPVHITGSVKADSDNPINLAITINGKISGVSRSFQHARREVSMFSVLVPETSFRKGKNDVEVFVVSVENGRLRLARTKDLSKVSYILASSEKITSSEGATIRVIPNVLSGSLDTVQIKYKNLNIMGWAADVEGSQLPETILIFEKGKFLYAGRCNMERPDVVENFQNKNLMRTGFRYRFPLNLKMYKGISEDKVRVFAVSSKGVASELFRSKKKSSTIKYFLVESKDEDIIISSLGKTIDVVKNALQGSLDTVTVGDNSATLIGWAADVKNSENADVIVIFVDGNFFHKGILNKERQDVVKTFNNNSLKKSGFLYSFPVKAFYTEPSEVRIFAISKRGVASELRYPEGYKWSKKS
jgi:hypothetical protein